MKKISLLIMAVFISGCAANVQTSSTQQGPKESTGAISGMIIGGALANDMAGGVKQSFSNRAWSVCWRCYWSEYWCSS